MLNEIACLAMAVPTASGSHLGRGNGLPNDSGAIALHFALGVAFAGAVTLAHMARENMVHGRCFAAS